MEVLIDCLEANPQSAPEVVFLALHQMTNLLLLPQLGRARRRPSR